MSGLVLLAYYMPMPPSHEKQLHCGHWSEEKKLSTNNKREGETFPGAKKFSVSVMQENDNCQLSCFTFCLSKRVCCLLFTFYCSLHSLFLYSLSRTHHHNHYPSATFTFFSLNSLFVFRTLTNKMKTITLSISLLLLALPLRPVEASFFGRHQNLPKSLTSRESSFCGPHHMPCPIAEPCCNSTSHGHPA